MSGIEGLAFRLETWTQGTGYVGIESAKDINWVGQILRDLHGNWPNPKDHLVNF